MAAKLNRLILQLSAQRTGAARAMLPPSVLPDITPTRGEIGSSLRDFANRQRRKLAKSPKQGPISPLVGEMSGRTEGGATGSGLQRSARKRRHG